VLDIASLSDAQMLQVLLKRANGSPTLKQLLHATLSVARERESERVTELEQALADAEADHPELEDKLQNIKDQEGAGRSTQRTAQRSHRGQAKMTPNLADILKNTLLRHGQRNRRGHGGRGQGPRAGPRAHLPQRL
jgi:hypothetical protein